VRETAAFVVIFLAIIGVGVFLATYFTHQSDRRYEACVQKGGDPVDMGTGVTVCYEKGVVKP
jgi:hypothetical protein